MCWLCRTAQGFTAEALSSDLSLADAPPRAEAVAIAPQDGFARLDLRSAGSDGINGLLSGYAWDGDAVVTFAFPDSASDYEQVYGSSEQLRGFGQIGPGMRDAVRQFLTGEGLSGAGAHGPLLPVTGFTGLTIIETADDAAADLRIARSSLPGTAHAYYPSWREGGDVWFGTRYNFNEPRLGSYQWLVGVHELGHALGLKHPHESWNGFAAMPAALDGLEFTVMSYRSVAGGEAGSGYTNGTVDYPQGWMMLDIAALQHLYGADYTWRAENTVYAWNPATGETSINGAGQGAPGDGTGGASNRVFLTIWDGGGVDTYDLSNYAGGVAVDLSPGGWSVLSSAQLALLDARLGQFTYARGNVFNALLHQDNTASLIENAVGGAGADTLAGNQGFNRLVGGGGGDRLLGRDGNDVLEGGAGADTLWGGAGHDLFLVQDALDLVVEQPGEGVDTLLGSHAGTLLLPAEVEALVLTGSARTGIGNGLGNLMTGSAFADRLEGLGGDDLLEGGAGNDSLAGGAGHDSFVLRRGGGFDLIEDFQHGSDALVLTGFGLTATQVLARAVATAGGVRLDLGGGDGLWLAGIVQLTPGDLVLG